MSPAFESPRSFPFSAFRAVVRQTALVTAVLGALGAVRLSAQAPGSLDTSFTSMETGFSFFAQALQYDDLDRPLLFVGGDRGGLNILDLNGNFGLSTPVAPPFGSAARILYTAVPEKVVEPDMIKSFRIVVGGQFGRSSSQFFAKAAAQNIFRLTVGGLIDDTFQPGRGANNFVTSILTLSAANGAGMIVGGFFDEFNGVTRERIVRLTSTGGIVPNTVFNPGLNFDGAILSLAPQIVPGSTLPDPAQFLAAGVFSNVSGVGRQKLARINLDGSLDPNFSPSFDDRTTIVLCQPDGKILVGGDFSNVNGTEHKHIVRLNFDGSVDPTFTARVTGTPAKFIDPPAVYVIKLLDDGSMYLGGNFTTVNGVTRRYLAHVDANGALDPTFDPGNNIINAVQSLTVQSDGRLIVGETVSRADPDKNYDPSLIRLYGMPLTVPLTLTASPASALTGSKRQGAFILTRNSAVSNSAPLTVRVTLAGGKGTAVPGTNYRPLVLSGVEAGLRGAVYTVSFPGGVSSITIPVVPRSKTINTTKFPNGKSVTLTLTDQPGQSATVNIRN